MTDDTMHLPTPEFREQLEWEVTRTFRREARLVALQRERRTRRLRAAAVIVACLGIGTATGLASAQVRDAARRDSLLAAAHADLDLVKLRLELARAQVDDVRRKARVGAAGPEAVAIEEAKLKAMEARMARMTLNIEEIRATLGPPRDELTAPVVSGRDFVQDRIMVDLAAAQEQLVEAERALAEARRRVVIGVVNETARAEAEVALARARAELVTLSDRRALRREFIEKATSADELALRLEESQLKQDLEVANEALRFARARLAAIQKQRAAGVTTELEVMRAQVELKERELELQQLMLRRQRLEALRRR